MPAVAAREDWELPAEPASVTLARGRVREFAQEHGATPDDVVDLTLAVTEAVTNSVIHAFIDRDPGRVRVTICTAADELTVVVADNGRGMQPRADSPGLGLGLPTIGRLAAHVDMREAPGGGTELSMTFATPGVRGPARGGQVDAREPELLDAVSRVAQGAWPGEGVERLVDLLVPDVADACAVDVIGASGHPSGSRGGSTARKPLSHWLATLRPRVDAARSATRAALEDGHPHVSELTLDLIERLTTSAEDARTMAATGIRWWAVIPLREGDRLLGLLHFGLLPARGRPSDELIEFLRTLGERAASGLAHTQLIAELRRMRHRFERVLDVLAEAVIVRDGEQPAGLRQRGRRATVRRRPDGAPRPQRRAGLRPLAGDDRSRRPSARARRAALPAPARRARRPAAAGPHGRPSADDHVDAARRGRAARRLGHPGRHGRLMASYSVNDAGVARARALIDARQYVLDSDWGDVQPNAEAQNKYLERHSWEDYAAWHLGLTEGANDETKARYAFVYGDFRRIHRSGLIACVYRAAEWRHKGVELAAHDLLQHLDQVSG